MTLREELEILRGEPIQVFTGDPQEIPCNETSDAEKLCKNPMVSVWMITYNHEPYIRQAIEGVVMQKTDFEYELVIGEDCSTDRTREICFEYQRKYPDKIRVLWSNQNLYRNPHPAGGNSQRTMAHCRGEFIALCEGDDYWIDPLKLQKQVDIMRKHPTVGFCFCGSKRYFQHENRYDVWNANDEMYHAGIQEKNAFFLPFLLGSPPGRAPMRWAGFLMTATTMIRKRLYQTLRELYDIFNWRLRLGDATLWLGASSLMDGYYLSDVVSVYRISNSGVFQNPQTRNGVYIDGIIVRLYYFRKCFNLELTYFPANIFFSFLCNRINSFKSKSDCRKYAWNLLRLPSETRKSVFRCGFILFWILATCMLFNRLTRSVAYRIAWHGKGKKLRDQWNPRVLVLYDKAGIIASV